MFTDFRGFAQFVTIKIERNGNKDNSINLSFKKDTPAYFFNVTNSSDLSYKTIIYGYAGTFMTLKPSNSVTINRLFDAIFITIRKAKF